MNAARTLPMAVAAVLISAAGCGPPDGDGTGQPSVSPAPAGSPESASEPVPSAAAAFPDRGALAAGTYTATIDGTMLSFSVPSGWIGDHGDTWQKIDKDDVGVLDGLPDGAAVMFWSPDGVYADPCGDVRAPTAGPDRSDLASAMSTIPGTDVVTGPSDVEVGGRPATHLVLTVRPDMACAPEEFFLWYDTVEAYRWATAAGDTVRIWIVDVGGGRLVIEAETRGGASAGIEAEVIEIVASVGFP